LQEFYKKIKELFEFRLQPKFDLKNIMLTAKNVEEIKFADIPELLEEIRVKVEDLLKFRRDKLDSLQVFELVDSSPDEKQEEFFSNIFGLFLASPDLFQKIIFINSFGKIESLMKLEKIRQTTKVQFADMNFLLDDQIVSYRGIKLNMSIILNALSFYQTKIVNRDLVDSVDINRINSMLYVA
jgi:hypothetical protein